MFVQKFIYSYENAQKVLPPELLLLAQIGLCTKSFDGWGFAPDPTGSPDLAGSGGGAPGEKEGRRGEGKEGGEGQALQGRQAGRVPECPNPELASLSTVLKCILVQVLVYFKH